MVAAQCADRAEFLNVKSKFPGEWRCEDCPRGAACVGSTVWEDVVALKGWWRIPWANQQFEECPFVQDCQGYDDGVAGSLGRQSSRSMPRDGNKNRSMIQLRNGTAGIEIEHCLEGTGGVLCSICKPGFNRDVLRCEKCQAESFPLRVSFVFVLIPIVGVMLSWCQRKLKKRIRLCKVIKHDLLRIASVMVTFAQINSSLPSVIEFQWPESWVAFVAHFNFVNIDLLDLIGTSCIGNFDFMISFVIMLLLPICILAFAFVEYNCTQRSARNKLAKMPAEEKAMHHREALHQLFKLADSDHSGFIDPVELSLILRQLGWKTSVAEAKDIMAQTPGVKNNESGYPALLSEVYFVKAMICGRMSEALSAKKIKRHRFSTILVKKQSILPRVASVRRAGKWQQRRQHRKQQKEKDKTPVSLRWTLQSSSEVETVEERHATLSTSERLVRWTVQRKHASNSFAAATQLLLLAHTPVSRKVFQYFHCNDIGGRLYLRADYSLSCYGDDWYAFLPVVLVVMFSFTVAVPLSISMYLRFYRHELYSTRIFQKVGFLYQPYRRGSEFWQIHDVVFKMVLTGVSATYFCPSQNCKKNLYAKN
jgi:hypothetical protein